MGGKRYSFVNIFSDQNLTTSIARLLPAPPTPTMPSPAVRERNKARAKRKFKELNVSKTSSLKFSVAGEYGKDLEVEVIRVEVEGIWVRDKTRRVEYFKLKDELRVNIQANPPQPLRDPKLGDGVLYHLPEGWARGRVSSLSPLRIIFGDLGQELVLRSEDLKALPEKLHQNFSAFLVKPLEWSVEDWKEEWTENPVYVKV